MTKRLASLTSALALVLGIVAFTGSALAGNGNGNGNANGNGNGNGNAATTAPAAATASQSSTATQSSAPGNSANAPGQQKKASTASSKGGGSASQNSPSTTGVKPTNATAHDTHCTVTSTGCTSTGANATTNGNGDASKRYGNGTTAAQIARKSGATGASLHGPGNSQPHKAALCPRGHEVDVHALKAKGQQKKCGVAAASKPATSHVTSNVTPTHAAAVSAAGAGPTGQRTTAQGGVLGAIEAAGGGVLPFTGYPLGIALLVALGLIVSGLGLRRIARETV